MKSARKFLLIRFSSIGDIVLTTPVIRALKEQVPESEIHFITKSVYHEVLENNSRISKIFLLKDSLSDLVTPLKSENYDMIIDLHKNIRSKWLTRKLEKPALTFDKLNIQKWLFTNFKINLLPDTHLVERYFQSFSSLGIENDRKGLEYYLTKKDHVDLQKMNANFNQEFIAWVIGGKHHTKKFPQDKIVEICQNIDVPIVMIGGNDDVANGKYIETHLQGKKILNLCGKLSINQSASVINQAIMVLTNDTGMMHVAAAFKKKIISFWGNTVPLFGMYPYLTESPSVMIENNNLSCRPCSKIGYARCPKKHFRCMMDLPVENIHASIKKLL